MRRPRPGMMAGSVVPMAVCVEAPSARILGVEITAPLMPNRPETSPVATPTATVNVTQRSGVHERAAYRMRA